MPKLMRPRRTIEVTFKIDPLDFEWKPHCVRYGYNGFYWYVRWLYFSIAIQYVRKNLS